MAEISMPWDGLVTGDAINSPYDAATEFATILGAAAGCFGYANEGGVCIGAENELEVTGAASPVQVNTGLGFVWGTFYHNTTPTSVVVPTPVGGNRIDRIVLRKSWANQTVRITRVAGVVGGGAPAMTQSDGVTWDTPLARVEITTGGVITITDDREYLPKVSFKNFGLTAFDADTVDGQHASEFLPSSGNAIFNSGVNAYNTKGITINQLDADDEGFSIQSTDVNHSMTNLNDPHTYMAVKKRFATGGLQIAGIMSGGTVGLTLIGYDNWVDTTRPVAVTSHAFIEMIGAQYSGADLCNMTAESNVIAFRAYLTPPTLSTLVCIDAEGDIHYLGSTVAYDSEDDAEAVADLNKILTGREHEAGRYNRDKFALMGIMPGSDTPVENSLISTKKVRSLMMGAISQMREELIEKRQKVAGLEEDIKALKLAVAQMQSTFKPS